MAARRPNGEGTVRYREKESRWEGRIVIGHKTDGKPIHKSVFGKTQKEVTTKLRALIEDYEGVEISEAQNKTIAEWLDIWFNEIMYNTIKPSTRHSYLRSIEKINKHIGNKPIKSVTTADIQHMYNYLRIKGGQGGVPLADASVRRIHMVLHKAMDSAVAAQMIVKNPTQETAVPKATHAEMKVFNDEQFDIFMEAIEKEPLWFDFFYTEMTTGLRRGEICALQWDDINFDNASISIRRNLVAVNGKLHLGTTKTKKGMRTFQLPPSTLELLKKKKQYAISEWVFPNQRQPAQPISPSSAYNQLKILLRKNNLPNIRFHDLRHTFATHAIRHGIDPKTLSRILGHENASFTLDTYTHMTSDMSKQGAVVVGGFLTSILGKEMKPWQRSGKTEQA